MGVVSISIKVNDHVVVVIPCFLGNLTLPFSTAPEAVAKDKDNKIEGSVSNILSSPLKNKLHLML